MRTGYRRGVDGGVRFLPAWRIFVNKEGGVGSFLDFPEGGLRGGRSYLYKRETRGYVLDEFPRV